MYVQFLNILLYIWLKLLEKCIEIWRIFLNFGQIMAIENPKKYTWILAL
jgi:hypothetical protein